MMDTEAMTPARVVETYKPDILKLAAYIPWFMQKKGQQAAVNYGQDGIATHSVSFPVYDSNLLRFVKDAENTIFIDPNYRYVYARYHIRNTQDELSLIQKAGIGQMNVLGGILSNYVLGGRVKGTLWSRAAQDGVFLAILTKAKEMTSLIFVTFCTRTFVCRVL